MTFRLAPINKTIRMLALATLAAFSGVGCTAETRTTGRGVDATAVDASVPTPWDVGLTPPLEARAEATPGPEAGAAAPTANIVSEPPEGYIPLTVSFDASGSMDPDGTIVSYDWDLDGDGVAERSGVTLQHQYLDPGTVAVTLTVTDDSGATATAVTQVKALVHPPQTVFREDFDTNPFPGQRWRVLHDDCATPKNGTVQYSRDQDGCGGEGGYIERSYSGGRCVVYDGPAFSTEGYEDLRLRYAYRLGGGGVAVATRSGANWSGLLDSVTASGAASWKQRDVPLTKDADGIRFQLNGSGSRRLDCIAIEGVPLSKPAVARVCPGSTAWFSVTAFESGALSHQWRHAGAQLSDGGNISGAKTAVLKIANVSSQDAGNYRCFIQTNKGTVRSNVSRLEVATKPTVKPVDSTLERETSSDADLAVTANGSGDLAYQWRKGGQDLTNGGRISGAQSPKLRISALQSGDAGQYTCVVTDDCGSAESSPVQLVVRSWDATVALPSEGTVSVDLSYAEDFIIEADLNGCDTTGVYQRYFRRVGRIDLMSYYNNRIAFRLANKKIWFVSGNVGTVSSGIGDTDHWGATIAASVSTGNHQVRIEYQRSANRCRLFWDGQLIGDWNLQIDSLPGNVGYLDTEGHIASGELRYYQGSFVSLAE